MNEERSLREIFDGTPMPSPDCFLLAAIAGYLVVIACVISTRFTSGISALILWVSAIIVGLLSSLESRLRRWLFERRFRNRARQTGFSVKEAQWLIENIDRILHKEDEGI